MCMQIIMPTISIKQQTIIVNLMKLTKICIKNNNKQIKIKSVEEYLFSPIKTNQSQ